MKFIPNCFFALFFIFCLTLQAQTVDIIDPLNKIKVKKRSLYSKKPYLLVETLLKDAVSDKEKFDRIYEWASNNIRFNYKIYYASGIFPPPDLSQILRLGKANSYEFTFLMDTLCSMAEIRNVSLYGYLKELLFDVNDSIYHDTHAWNAVKLDNNWYLYDITLSNGYVYYDFSRFSRFIIKLRNKLTVKYVPKTVKRKKKKYFRNATCGGALASEGKEEKIKVLKVVYRHKLLRKILGRFKLKIIRMYRYEPNMDYYLTNPELLAITHYPDDPDWSLVAARDRLAFEADSAYYHLEEFNYVTQKRVGRTCVACDSYLGLDDLSKAIHYRKQSLKFNSRNHFSPSVCEYKIAGLKLDESKKTEDSLTKVTLLDTALAFIQHAKDNFLKASANLNMNAYLQDIKNRNKLSMLIDDNKTHSQFIRSKMELSFKETKNIRDLENKFDTDAKKFYFRNRIIDHYKKGTEIDQDAKRVELTIQQLKSQLDTRTILIDSLERFIKKSRVDFDAVLPELNKTLWKKINNHDSLLTPLIASIKMRQGFSDNYKKNIIEVREIMLQFENNYLKEVDSSIYKPAEFCYALGNQISYIIEQRNRISYECYRIKCQLVKFKEIDPSAIDKYKVELKRVNMEDLCWIKENNNYLQAIFYGFKALLAKQKGFDELLRSENRAEVRRFNVVNKELAVGKRSHQKILCGSRKIANVRNKQIKKVKSDYLRELRKERREARIKR